MHAKGIYLALGSNLPSAAAGPPLANCERALELLVDAGVEVVRRSSWYRSAPVPKSDQPDFVNGVVALSTRLGPEPLLAVFHRIEAELGRERGAPNAARVIDLDLLAWHARILGRAGGAAAGLVLPHPRLHDRAFVLLPLHEIAPGWRHPVTGAALRAMIEALPKDQFCERLG